MYFEFQEQPQQGATWSPTVDVCERVDRSDVQLAWNDGVLIISGLKRQQGEGEGTATYLCVERAYGHFRRDISVKVPIDTKHAKAELKNGLMKIYLPKRTEAEITTIPIL
jgi:HSP20 family protein